MSDIKIMRLVRGDELICELSIKSPDTYLVKNPLRIVVVPQKNNQNTTTNIAFGPWIEFSNDSQIKIDRNHVLCVLTPLDEFVHNYQQMFGKIITPPNKLVLPEGF